MPKPKNQIEMAYMFFWDQGFRARKDGIKVNECPYDQESIERDVWMSGWLEADKDLV